MRDEAGECFRCAVDAGSIRTHDFEIIDDIDEERKRSSKS
jgi:hypothetical protein